MYQEQNADLLIIDDALAKHHANYLGVHVTGTLGVLMKCREMNLIEVAIPLEAINTASAKEKSIRHGHPSTLHLWWRARNVTMDRLQDAGIVNAAKGRVRLKDRDELPEKLPSSEGTWNWVQILVRELRTNGIEGCAKRLVYYTGDSEEIKNLAYRLYQIADKKGWSQEGTGYNHLVISWQDILARREELRSQIPENTKLEL